MVERPRFHFTPPVGWMNDPNGLVFVDGEYHLFYQYHPHSLSWGPMHWGHAVSTDLLTWEHLPIALAPDALGTIFSGSAVWDGENTSGLVPGGGLVALFSFDTQAQGLAFSTDKGRSWTKFEGNPVIPALAKDFRDPKVFWDGDRWSMVLAAGDHLQFYSSPNLRQWTRVGQFEVDLDVGVWECPDLFPLETPDGRRWVLLLSIGDKAVNGGSGTLYWVGSWDGAGFTPSSGPHPLDGGTDNYAGVTWNGAPDRLFLGWMSNWRYGRTVPARTWRGAMTLPRVLGLEGPWLVQSPIAELKTRRRAGHPLPATLGRVSDTELTLVADAPRPVALTLSHEGGLQVVLVWDRDRRTLVLDRSRAGLDFDPLWVKTMTATLKTNEPRLDLRLVLDTHSIEVFAEGGKTVVTAVFFQGAGEVGRWSLSAQGSALEGTSWDLV